MITKYNAISLRLNLTNSHSGFSNIYHKKYICVIKLYRVPKNDTAYVTVIDAFVLRIDIPVTILPTLSVENNIRQSKKE